MAQVSKDGITFYEIPDDPAELEKARAKGYRSYVDVSKDGQQFSIPDDPTELEKAQAKGYTVSSPKVVPSQGEAFLKGAQQGATFGFADELSGAADVVLKKFGDVLLPEGTENPYKDKSSSEVYRAGRDEVRAQQKKLEEAHPGTVLSGSIIGGILIPGAAGALGAAGKGLKGAAAAGAIEGGLAGAGTSEEENVAGLAADVGTGAALGAGFGGALHGVGKAAKKLFTGKNHAAADVAKYAEFDDSLIVKAEDKMLRDRNKIAEAWEEIQDADLLDMKAGLDRARKGDSMSMEKNSLAHLKEERAYTDLIRYMEFVTSNKDITSPVPRPEFTDGVKQGTKFLDEIKRETGGEHQICRIPAEAGSCI